MSNNFKRITCGSMFLASLAMVGCSTTNESKPNPATTTNPAANSQSKSAGQKLQAVADSSLRAGQDKSSLDALRRGDTATTPAGSALKEIYFEFDSYDLSTDARTTLKTAADWLKKNSSVSVDIEGHCDERGTNEYNLALGAKRAQAAKDYLTSLGVSATRLSTTSYGEEIPVCREHNEDCWAKNRRDRFVTLTAKPNV